MRTPLLTWIAAVPTALAITLASGPAAWAQSQGDGAPAGFVAPAEPKPDDSNAERGKSQPGNNAPFWRAVRGSGEQAGYTSMTGSERGTLIQSLVQYPGSRYTTAGEAWRQVRNRWIVPYGGALMLIVALAVALFYLSKGSLGGHLRDTGRKVERFSYVERAAHWSVAISFVVLAVSGIVIAFGKFALLPLLGPSLYGWLAFAMKNLHNFAGPLFAVALLVVLLTFVRDNLPRAVDWQWIRTAGGLFGGEEAPSHRFNAGEKLWFWGGVFFLGLIVVGSGLVLDMLVPELAYTRETMQIANMIHGVATILMMTMFLGHVYMGTIGMKGAYAAMRTGYVDEAWAEEHHRLWYADLKSGHVAAPRRSPPAADAAGART